MHQPAYSWIVKIDFSSQRVGKQPQSRPQEIGVQLIRDCVHGVLNKSPQKLNFH